MHPKLHATTITTSSERSPKKNPSKDSPIQHSGCPVNNLLQRNVKPGIHLSRAPPNQEQPQVREPKKEKRRRGAEERRRRRKQAERERERGREEETKKKKNRKQRRRRMTEHNTHTQAQQTERGEKNQERKKKKEINARRTETAHPHEERKTAILPGKEAAQHDERLAPRSQHSHQRKQYHTT